MKKIAIIGSGASGLSAIKCCLDEGLEPVCFERTDDIGGLWNFTEEVRDGQACVMRSTIINTCKEMMSFSDFPVPDHFPNFMHNSKVKTYFEMYTEHFGLRKCIQFNTEVLSVTQSDNYSSTGQWIVASRDKTNNTEASETFDGVMVCSGHHVHPKMPTFEGQKEFQGKIIHSHDYKDCSGLRGKRVVIVGFGNSGADCMMDASQMASQVFLSTRRGAWVVPRTATDGLPADLKISTRFNNWIMKWFSWNAVNDMIEKGVQKEVNHELFGIKPEHRFLECHVNVCDGLPNKINSGTIRIKPDVRRLTSSGVEFTDGSFEDNIDLIVSATGYVFGFPFVKHPALAVKDNRINLYKFVFPPDLEHPTLAVIGCVQPLGSTISLAELQNRWVSRVFKGSCELPPPQAMWTDLRATHGAMAARYIKSTRHTLQVDWIDYLDQIASLIGCKPSFWSLLIRDRQLAFAVLFGPFTPLQFRITGPGKWTGARAAVLGIMSRILKPLETGRKNEIPVKKSSGRLRKLVFVAAVAVVIKLYFFQR